MSSLPVRQTAMRPQIEMGGAVVAINSCCLCGGTQVCPSCDGRGKKRENGSVNTCQLCGCSGRCHLCVGHCRMLRQFAQELRSGWYGEAEAGLQGELVRVAKAGQSSKSAFGIGGAGLGAILGTVVAPGLGTIVGLSVGKMLGDAVEPDDSWRHSDVLYCLGVLYAAQGRRGEAEQAWIKSLALNQNNVAARAALRGPA